MVIDFSPFYDLPRDIGRLFDTFTEPVPISRRRASYPLINVAEDEDNFYVDAKIPGVTMDDIDLTLTENDLVIKGERKSAEGSYFRQERGLGAFQRVLGLNAPVDRDKAKASFKDGILSVVLPKAESVKPKKIAIES
jgi:HSP20 family protein